MENLQLKEVIETILFITDRPLKISELREISEAENDEEVRAALSQLQTEYLDSGRAVAITSAGGGFQMSTKPEYGRWVRKLYKEKMVMRLSAAALETLAIIAYRQPITRAEVEGVRGVDAIATLEGLVEKGLVKIAGKKETVGRPLLYAVTDEFLRTFGLSGIDDLPKLENMEVSDLTNKPKQDELFDVAGAMAQEETGVLAEKPAEPSAEYETNISADEPLPAAENGTDK